MAQDTRKALDDKTRKLSQGKIEDGKEHAAYQEAQQQLLAIQAEQQQNLAVARAESKASFENNQTLAQAAELGAISAAEAEQAAAMGAQAGVQLNPATQQILSKYGAGQPRFSRSQSHSQQVTKQNITINNNITSNTTNDVNVPANIGGPIQGRPLQFKNPSTSTGTDSVGKFKTWISSAFARQNEEGAKRDREYRNRESSLTKSASKMMKKLEDVGKTIGSRMDPRKIGSTWQSQLKTLLLLFGFGYLTSNWTKVLSKVSDIEQWIRGVYKYFAESDSNGNTPFLSKIKQYIGADEEESILEGLGKLLGEEGLWGKIKGYFSDLYEDRAKAIKEIKFPEIDFSNAIDTIKALGEYLGNVLGALVGGTSAVEKTISKQATAEAAKSSVERAKSTNSDSVTKETKTITNSSGQEFKGDRGVLSFFEKDAYKNPSLTGGLGLGHTRYSLNADGTLNQERSVESTMGAANNILRVKENIKNGDLSEASSIALDLNNLYKEAQRIRNTEKHGIPVPPDFLRFLTKSELNELSKSKDIGFIDYDVVLRKKSQSDYTREGLNSALNGGDAFVSAEAQKTIFGNDWFGGKGSTLFSKGGLAAINSKAGAWADKFGTDIRKWFGNDSRFELVRFADKNSNDYQYTGVKQRVYEVSPKAIKIITSKLTTGATDNDINPEDKSKIQKLIYAKGRSDRLAKIEADEKYLEKQPWSITQAAKLRSIRKEKEKLYNTGTDYNAFAEEEKARERLSQKKEEGDKPVNRIDRAYENILDDIYSVSNGRYGTPKSQKEYVAMVRPLLLKTLESKNFVPKNKVEEYADLLTAQSGLESGWGQSELNLKYNNYSGMTSGTAKYHKVGSVTMTNKDGKDKNSYAVFNSVEDWADEYVEYLNRKWNAFNGDTTQYFNRLKNNKTGQSYAVDPNYIKKNTSALAKVKSISGSKDIAKYEKAILSADVSNFTEGGNSSGHDEVANKKEARSFFDILKENFTKYIANPLGVVNETVSPITDDIKSKIFKNGYAYTGPITKEFVDYEEYLKNQDKLPKDLPPGLSSTEWENAVYDMTGSFPHYQKLRDQVVEADKEESKKGSKTKEILDKYTIGETDSETNIENLSPEIKADLAEEGKIEPVTESSPSPLFNMLTDNFEKKEDKIETVVDYMKNMQITLDKIFKSVYAGATATADVKDAVDRGTQIQTGSARQMTNALLTQQKNNVETKETLMGRADSYKGVVS